jgi:hypothetical protein
VSWFAVRTIYLHGRDPDGRAVYEERTILFRADTPEEAFDLAEAESRRYLEFNPTFEKVAQPSAFLLGEKGNDLHGAEVWSVLSSSELGPDEFVQRHYTDIAVDAEDE